MTLSVPFCEDCELTFLRVVPVGTEADLVVMGFQYAACAQRVLGRFVQGVIAPSDVPLILIGSRRLTRRAPT